MPVLVRVVEEQPCLFTLTTAGMFAQAFVESELSAGWLLAFFSWFRTSRWNVMMKPDPPSQKYTLRHKKGLLIDILMCLSSRLCVGKWRIPQCNWWYLLHFRHLNLHFVCFLCVFVFRLNHRSRLFHFLSNVLPQKYLRCRVLLRI